ncbi:MAG: hypothetical protein AAF291_07205 [Pseudomonadota bacterium]
MKLRFTLTLATLSLILGACTPGTVRSKLTRDAVAQSPLCADRLAGTAQSFAVSVQADAERAVEITVFAPAQPGIYPLLAFSHGAFASPDRYTAMLEPLAGAGFIVLAPMHIDSEDYPRAADEPKRPPHPITWSTRNADFALALEPPENVLEALEAKGLKLDEDRTLALGHSYGALIAQLPGGALAFEPDGSQINRANAKVDAVVGWSPPGAMPGFMANEGWSSLSAPSLTLTGTADILPGFIDDWTAHKAAHDFAPVGARALWVGEDIDHYFGGVFGRVEPASERELELFERALATSLYFMETRSGLAQPCRLGDAIAGERFEEDTPK